MKTKSVKKPVPFIVLSTCASLYESEKMAEQILNNKLAACVQIEKIKSLYLFKGKIENADEYRLTIKTTQDKYKQLEQFIHSHHSYEIAQIVAFKIKKGSEDYLNWLADEMK